MKQTAKKTTPAPAAAPKPARPSAADIRRKRTRRRIKKAASKVFAKKGFDTANVSDIVNSIGMAQGSFYYHFDDKRAVLLEVIEDFFAEVRKLTAEFARTADSGPEVTTRFATALAGVLYENREPARIVMMESHNNDREIRNRISAFQEFLYRQTQLGLELGISLGVVRRMNTRIAAVALVGMVQTTVADQLDAKGPIDLMKVIEEMAALQNYGIRPR